MSRLLRFFLERHLLVNVIVVAVLAIGLFVVSRSQREGFPAVDLNLAQVTAVLPGASAEEVETKLTIPIERALRGVDGIRSSTSISAESASGILLELFDDLDAKKLEEAIADVQTALDGVADLPAGLDFPPRVVLFNPARIPALEVFLHGKRRGEVVAAARDLERVLARVPGVSEVVPVGYGDPEIHVLVDPARLRAHGLTLDEVLSAIERRNRSDTGGKLETAGARRLLVIRGQYADPAEVAGTILRTSPGGSPLRVSDIARVELSEEDRGVLVHADGHPGVSLVVRKRARADIIRVVDDLRQAVSAFSFPAGVGSAIYRDSSQIARDRLEVVAINGVGGIALVILVLMLFLTRRIAIWVAFGIPFAVLGTGALLPALGITVNMVSMAAFVLVIGLIVDDAIVVAERIAFWREQGLPPREAGVEGAREMALPVLGSSLTTVMAFSPMFAVGGLPGRFAWSIPAVVVVALAASLFECFFLLPAHVSADHGKAEGADRKAAWIEGLEDLYRQSLRRVLAHKKKLVAAFVLFFAVSMAYAAAFMPITLFPQDDAKVLFIKLEMPLGTTLEETSAAATFLEGQLPALLGGDLKETVSRVGHRQPQSSKDRGDAENEAILSVFLVDDFQRNALVWGRELQRALTAPPGARLLFEHQQVGPPLGRPVTVHVGCDDDARRRAATHEVEAALSAYAAVTDLDDDDDEGLRQIDLRPDWNELARLGVDPEVLSRTLKAAFLGLPVTETRRSDAVTRIRVRFDTAGRQNLDLLLDTPVRTRLGELVLLRNLVAPAERPGTARIPHRNGVRTTTITASIDPDSGETASTLAKKLRREVLSRPSLQAPGLDVTIGGEAEKSAETVGELPFVALMALVGMWMIVTLLFGSFLQAFFILVAVPLGYAGVVWTFAAHGIQLSFFALLGAIGLSGVVVNDSIVMVSTLTERGGDDIELDGVVQAAGERLRPVLLTTLTTVVGVLPTAYGLGGRDVMLSPMSLALGWGLTFATLVTLFLVPALFLLRHEWVGRRRPAGSAAPAA